MTLTNKSVLVTGGAGFVGSNLVDRILQDNPKKLVVVDNLFLGKRTNLNKEVQLHTFSALITNKMLSTISANQIDVVFNLAVIPLPVSLTMPVFCFTENVGITQNLCELLRKGCYKTLIHFSSSEVYGTAQYVPMGEDHPLNGITPYAASKIASDALVLSYYKTFGLDISIVRPFNIYGPRQNNEGYAGVIPITLKRIINNESPIIEGNGKQTRDFSYVTDVVDAAVRIYECLESRGIAVNIASGQEITIEEIINILNTENMKVIYKDKRIGDVDRHLADISLAKKLINYEPKINYKVGLEKTKEWYIKEGTI